MAGLNMEPDNLDDFLDGRGAETDEDERGQRPPKRRAGADEEGEEPDDDQEDAQYRRRQERGSSRGNRGRERDWWKQDRRGSGGADGWLGL